MNAIARLRTSCPTSRTARAQTHEMSQPSPAQATTCQSGSTFSTGRMVTSTPSPPNAR